MPFEPVDDVDDPRIAVYRDLPRSNLTRPSGLFIAEGRLLVERLLASGWDVESILLDERDRESSGLAWPVSTPIYVVPSALVNQILGFKFHRGVLACGRRRDAPTLDDFQAWRLEPRRPLTAVVCVDVHDPENMGVLLRNSAAFGADLVLTSRSCADPFSRRVLRTSMGTVWKLPIVSSDDLPRDLRRLRDEWGVELAATVLDDAAESLDAAVRPGRFGLVFGNEGHGLSREVIDLCRRRVTLPMRLGTDSLNVGVAAGIFLYHFSRPAALDDGAARNACDA